MDWKSIAGTVAKSAPMLGTVLGGPLGGAVGGVVSMIGSAFGLSTEETTPEAIEQIIKQDPQALVKLKEIELLHKTELEKLVIQSDHMFLQDRQSARQREIDIVKSTGQKDYNLYILAWMVVLLFFGLVGIMMFIDLPDGNLGPVNQLFGAMAAGFGMVLQYFFGSSKSSSDKNKHIMSGR